VKNQLEPGWLCKILGFEPAAAAAHAEQAGCSKKQVPAN
jgi:hypothetical protein